MSIFCQAIAYNKNSNSGQNPSRLIATVSEKLSELVARRLKELKISKAELARLTGLSRTYITDIANATANTQNGQYRPSPEVAEKLAKYLKVSIEEITGSIGYAGTDKDSDIPEQIRSIDFSVFDNKDLEEIAEFVEFKKLRKQRDSHNSDLRSLPDKTAALSEKQQKHIEAMQMLDHATIEETEKIIRLFREKGDKQEKKR